MKYRLIASDIDGTLTEVWDQVNEQNRLVLKKLVDEGVAFMIATGRSYRSAQAILQSLDIPCYACLINGAVIISYPDLQLLHTNYLSVEEKNMIMEKVQQIAGHAVIYNGFERGDKTYYTDTYYLNPVLKKIINTEVDRRILVHDLINDIQHPVPVVSCVGTEVEIDALFELLLPFQERFNIVKLRETYDPGYYWIMVTHKGSDKVHGIQQIGKILGISREETIAIGDDLNDLEMIKYAGLGIAMDNGVLELKAVADIIAPPCSEDGMARILEKVYAVTDEKL